MTPAEGAVSPSIPTMTRSQTPSATRVPPVAAEARAGSCPLFWGSSPYSLILKGNMMISHTDQRILKLARKGLSLESIARKIGRPGDVERVLKALERPTQGKQSKGPTPC